jgi:hypothetical protein
MAKMSLLQVNILLVTITTYTKHEKKNGGKERLFLAVIVCYAVFIHNIVPTKDIK